MAYQSPTQPQNVLVYLFVNLKTKAVRFLRTISLLTDPSLYKRTAYLNKKKINKMSEFTANWEMQTFCTNPNCTNCKLKKGQKSSETKKSSN